MWPNLTIYPQHMGVLLLSSRVRRAKLANLASARFCNTAMDAQFIQAVVIASKKGLRARG
ncbi:MAG: hypothetical protein ACJATG_001912, partial [Dinoroseobacter sp.]